MVFEKVREFLVDILLCNEDDITPESEFGTDIQIDSIDLVDLVMRLEDEFGISIADDEGVAVKTVADVVKLVEDKMN